MQIKRKFILPYHIVSILIGAILFLYGFFPITYSNDNRAELRDLPNFIDDIPLNTSIYRSHVSRTILMVIDALRSDFIQHQQNLSMKYLNKMINEKSGCSVNLEVEVPTVTMPRIKAITTGAIPNFIDVVLNLGSSELKMDSLLHQTYDNGGKIVFCGDNTWVKMFPQMFHRKLENQDSFYVNDFHEGDKNITQKLSLELKRDDWELLILHFLGLDHIGHVEGPFSTKVGPKLREMDTVIMHIHLAMLDWMKSGNAPPLLMVTGDHGMRDSGGHGGSSYSEINVPFILIGPSCYQNGETFRQIDITATISILLGLPIPAPSIGTIIPNFLQSLSMEQQLYAYFYNGQRLLQKITEYEGDVVKETEFYKQFIDAKKAHKSFLKADDKMENSITFKMAELRYITSSAAMSQRLTKLYVNFDHLSIALGIICLLLATCGIALSTITVRECEKFSLIYAILISLPLVFLQPYICTEISLHSTFCVQQFELIPRLLLALIYSFLFINVQLIYRQCRSAELSSYLKILKNTPFIFKFIIFGVMLHTISALSSSFIEEEHQIWYYLNSTVFVLLFLSELNEKKSANETNKTSVASVPYAIGWSQVRWILLFCGHLIGRRLNQTGDKWLNEPDIGDWLQMEEHRIWNSFFASSSLLLLHISCLDFGSILTNVLTMTTCMLIYYYKTLKGSVYFAGIKVSESTGTCMLLFWLNIVEIFAINCVPVLYKTITSNIKRFDIKLFLGTLIVVTTLVITLTHKPHNIFLIPLLLFTCDKLNQCCRSLYRENGYPKLGLIIQCILHLWIGKLFYFYQGNSNSLATIDLNAGYTGQNTFSFVSVAYLLTLNTYTGPILSFLILIYNLYDCSEQSVQRSKDLSIVLPCIAVILSLPFTVYIFIILSFRHHIFIWSVFSPKLLYDFYYLCLMIILWIFASVVSTVL